MKGVSFLGFHSYRDLNLLMTSKEIGSPEVKRQTIDIEGADGELDFTDFFGEPKYLNVQHRFDFESIQPRNEQLSQFADIKNKIHGKKGRIILDDDPSFFYVGRCFVSAYKPEKVIGRISIECDCEPYKYKVDKTAILRNLSGKNLFDCINPQIATAYHTEVTSLATGVRVTSISQGQWRYAQFKIAPIKMLAGRTITLTCKATASEGAAERVGLGYFKNPYSPLTITVYMASNSNKVSLTVDEKYAETYDSVGLWLYSSRDSNGQANSYVDYTDVQVEIGSVATEYEPYDNASNTVIELVPNARKTVTPVLCSSKPVTVTHNGYTLAMAAETEYTVPEFELKEGNNEFTITGSGLVSFTYQEGSL